MNARYNIYLFCAGVFCTHLADTSLVPIFEWQPQRNPRGVALVTVNCDNEYGGKIWVWELDHPVLDTVGKQAEEASFCKGTRNENETLHIEVNSLPTQSLM